MPVIPCRGVWAETGPRPSNKGFEERGGVLSDEIHGGGADRPPAAPLLHRQHPLVRATG